jgi:glutamine synthetase
MPHPADRLAELEQQLRRQGLKRLAITWVNHAGAVLVKVVPIGALANAVRVGVGFSPVSDAFRSDGVIDPLHRLARPDGDLRLRADPASLAPLEAGSGWAWAAGSRHSRDGGVHPGDQRGFCARQQQALARSGLKLQAGFELEWMVGTATGEGQDTLVPAMAGGPYGADRLVEGLDYAAALTDACDAAGLPWLQLHPEYGQGQFELSLAAAPPLEAADRLVLARLLIQRVSRRFGWRCSFSPKPLAEAVGNGGHVHLSVACNGNLLLQGGEEPGGLQPGGAAVVASLLQHLTALLPLACASAVSYRRLAPGSWSAPFLAWGIENRETALRLVPAAADGAPAHLELKVADLSANPYLLLGALQAVVGDALEQQTPAAAPVAAELPLPVVGDPARLGEGAPARLPASLAEASQAFAASTLLRQALGDPLHASLIDSQQAEIRRADGLDPEALLAASRWWPVVGGH